MTNVPFTTPWPVVPLGRLFRRETREPGLDQGVVTAFRDGNVMLRSRRRTDGFTEALQEIGYQGIRKGDLVIHAMDGFAGAIGVSQDDGKSSPVYSALTPIHDDHPPYYAYLLRALAGAGYIQSLSQGIRERSTDFRWVLIKTLPTPRPDAETQRRIADYLDHETAEIDAFVDSADRLVQLSRERLDSRSSSTLLCGTKDPLGWTEDHKIPWLQGVPLPAHWQFKKLSYIATLRSGNQFTSANLIPNGRFSVYGGGGLRGRTDTYTHAGDRVLIGRQGALAGKVFTAEGPFFATEHAIVVTQNEQVDPRWFESILRLMNLGQYSIAAAQPGISVDTISKLKLPEPPFREQVEIGESIERHRTRYSNLKADVDQAIQLARERRAALITAAVTGQIDVTARNKPAAEQLEDDIAQGLHREN